MKTIEIGWSVKLLHSVPRGNFESGASAMFSDAMGPMEVIAEVARWRGVDLSTCHAVEARMTGNSLERETP